MSVVPCVPDVGHGRLARVVIRSEGKLKVLAGLAGCRSLPVQQPLDGLDDLQCGIDSQLFLDMFEKIRKSGTHNFLGLRIKVPSNLHLSVWRSYLSNYDDAAVCDMLEFGWPIGFSGEQEPVSALINHKGALAFESHVDEYLVEEVRRGAILGPFNDVPVQDQVTISPLNTVPKGVADRRIIVDLSFPVGQSVNSGISREVYLGHEINLSFPSIDAFVALVRSKGKGALMYKRDLSRAYRQLPIDPGDIRYLGLWWRNKLFLDRMAAMGLRSAAQMCQRTTSAVVHIMKLEGWDVCNYLDDHGGVEVPLYEDVPFMRLGEVLDELGLDESVKKACAPSTCMDFTGVQVDSVSFEMSVTPERLNEIEQLTAVWLGKKSASKKQLQSLIGKLQFVAKCVPAGRVFISRLLEQLRCLHRSEHRFKVSGEVRKDIRWWRECIRLFNGTSIMLEVWWRAPDAVLATDASLLGGGGVQMQRMEFFHVSFPEWVKQQARHINALELWTLVVALKVWGGECRGMRIKVLCDNEASVSVVNTGRSRDAMLCQLLRELCYWAVKDEFVVRGEHVAGVDNRLPDCLSRWDDAERFRLEFKARTGPGWHEVCVQEDIFKLTGLW